MPPFRAVPPEEIARLKYLYEDTGVPVRDLAHLAGMGISTFMRRIHLWKWKHRRSNIADYDRAVAHGLDLRPIVEFTEPLMATVETARVLAEVRSAVETLASRISVVLKNAEDVAIRSPDAERAARTLGTVLRVMRELDVAEGVSADAKAEEEFRDLDAFCAELSRRLDGIRRGDAG
jgi:hypothetical protein